MTRWILRELKSGQQSVHLYAFFIPTTDAFVFSDLDGLDAEVSSKIGIARRFPLWDFVGREWAKDKASGALSPVFRPLLQLPDGVQHRAVHPLHDGHRPVT